MYRPKKHITTYPYLYIHIHLIYALSVSTSINANINTRSNSQIIKTRLSTAAHIISKSTYEYTHTHTHIQTHIYTEYIFKYIQLRLRTVRDIWSIFVHTMQHDLLEITRRTNLLLQDLGVFASSKARRGQRSHFKESCKEGKQYYCGWKHTHIHLHEHTFTQTHTPTKTQV